MNRTDLDEVVNACDAGREGELIFRLVYNTAGCKKPIKRLWISSMEESAVHEGFANLKDGSDYDNSLPSMGGLDCRHQCNKAVFIAL